MWVYWSILASILVTSLIGSIYWTRQNVIFVGHDSTSYMVAALDYHAFLTPLTWQAIFRAFTEPEYRVPGLYIAAQPFMFLFGVDMDGAQMVNVAAHGVVILLTLWLGFQVTGRWPSLFAAALVAFLPMMAAMARLFYSEMLLTAAVALNLLALFKSDGFARRGWSLAWGLSLGVGLLVKWTMPMYVGLPMVALLWSARRTLLPSTWRINARAALAAVIPALAFAIVWYVPNRALISRYPHGEVYFFAWFFLTWAFAYALLLRSSPAANLFAGVFGLLFVVSLWYLPHSNIVQLLLEIDRERASQTPGLFNWANYLRYGRYFYQTHLGPLAFWVIVPAALFPWLWSAFVRRRWLNRKATLLLLSVCGAVAVLVMISQGNQRNIVAILPQTAILIAIAFSWYPRYPRWVFGSMALIVLATQWLLISTDRFASVFERSKDLWVDPTQYVMAPASGLNDPEYWIAPDLFADVTSGARERPTLAMGMNKEWLHRGQLRYFSRLLDRPLSVVDLTESGASWSDLMSSEWVALMTTENSPIRKGIAAELTDRVRKGDRLFDALYSLAAQWQVPSGEVVSLYHREGKWDADALDEVTEPWNTLAEDVRTAWSKEATLVYASPDLAVLGGRYDPAAGSPVILDDQRTDPVSALSKLDDTIFVVLNVGESHVTNWLDDNAYKAREWGDDAGWVCAYGAPDGPLTQIPTSAKWGDVLLESLQTQSKAVPGAVIPLRVSTTSAQGREIKWSVRLTDARGTVIASADRPLLAQDHFGLFVPPDAPYGAYRVIAIAYDPATLTPITNQDGATEVPLFDVLVSSP